MPAVALILVLLAAAAALDLLAERIGVPHPVLLVLGGLLLAVTPGLPRATLNPEIIFLIFVPPLLYSAAIRTSFRDLWTNFRSIAMLAVGLVIATTLAVAVVARAMVPGLSWARGCLLGAIVAPPDAVAVVAVTRRLRIPTRLAAVLEGEGLLNDATALIAYRIALGAATSSEAFSWAGAALQFAAAAGGGLAIGYGVGLLVIWLRRRVRNAPEFENTVSLLTPFAAYIAADRIGASGVLAVVAAGLYVGRQGPRMIAPETRIEAAGMWDMVTFVLEGLIFVLVGLELPLVTGALHGREMETLIGYGVAISVTIIVVRMVWVFPSTYVPVALGRWLGTHPRQAPPRGRAVLFAGWAGMRGADSLVIALALPLSLSARDHAPGRELIIFVTFVVILVTLVLQGLTLAPVIRALRLGDDNRERDEELDAEAKIARAGLARLETLRAERPDLETTIDFLKERHRHRVHRFEGRKRRQPHDRDEKSAADYRDARCAMLDAERGELVRLRDDGSIGDDVMRRIQRDLDYEQLLLDRAIEQSRRGT